VTTPPGATGRAASPLGGLPADGAPGGLDVLDAGPGVGVGLGSGRPGVRVAPVDGAGQAGAPMVGAAAVGAAGGDVAGGEVAGGEVAGGEVAGAPSADGPAVGPPPVDGAGELPAVLTASQSAREGRV
jgi:hypothetical protein